MGFKLKYIFFLTATCKLTAGEKSLQNTSRCREIDGIFETGPENVKKTTWTRYTVAGWFKEAQELLRGIKRGLCLAVEHNRLRKIQQFLGLVLHLLPHHRLPSGFFLGTEKIIKTRLFRLMLTKNSVCSLSCPGCRSARCLV